MNGATDLVFVDTNVLLYTLDAANPLKQAAALRWCDVLWQSQTGRLSWQVLDEFYANATRKIGAPAPTIRRLVKAYARWKPLCFSIPLIERAWHWTDRAQLTYWDALILAAAERFNCRWLLSEDFIQKRRYAPVEVISLFFTEPEGFGAA
ncbi:MAG TPA: PIN domain-containing protein [Bryobacteraceae bacterium]|nr:PIN domain-containing protein [Bryobacteraceae bacterium]